MPLWIGSVRPSDGALHTCETADDSVNIHAIPHTLRFRISRLATSPA